MEVSPSDGPVPSRAERPARLLVVDTDDLAVVSAHVQDAVVCVRDFRHVPRQRCFVLLMNRFRWEDARRKWRFFLPYRRIRAVLHFDDVSEVKVRNFDPKGKDEVLALLSVTFEPREPPGGIVHLTFAGGAEVALTVDCLGGRLSDLGPSWATVRRPSHSGSLARIS